MAEPTAANVVVEFDNVTKVFNEGTPSASTAIRDISFQGAQPAGPRRVHLHPGTFRLRQVDHSADDRRSAAALPADQRARARSWASRLRVPARIAGWSFRTTPRSTTGRCSTTSRSDWSAPGRRRKERDGAGAGMDRQGRAQRHARCQQVSASAFRRHAPARGHRAHADSEAEDHSDGRAVRRARSGDAAQHAGSAGQLVARAARPRSSSSRTRWKRRSTWAIGCTSSHPLRARCCGRWNCRAPDRPARVMQREPAFTRSGVRDPRHNREAGRIRASGAPHCEQIDAMASASSEPPLPGRSAGLREYLKRGFLYRWNLLLFAGGVGAALLSPWPDAVLPLVAAAEAVYLGGLISFPKFRDAIDAQIYQESAAAADRERCRRAAATGNRRKPGRRSSAALRAGARPLPGDARDCKRRSRPDDRRAAIRRGSQHVRARPAACGCFSGCWFRRRR